MKSITINIIFAATVFVAVYIILIAIGSLVSWSNLFIVNTAYKGVACFISFVLTLISIMFINTED